MSSFCVILKSLAITIFDLPEPYEKSFWGQWKYAHSIQQTVWTRHILELTGNLPRKWWRIWVFFFLFFYFFFPFPEECDDSLWLKLIYDFHWETACAPNPVQLPARPTWKQNVTLTFFLSCMYPQTMRLFSWRSIILRPLFSFPTFKN